MQQTQLRIPPILRAVLASLAITVTAGTLAVGAAVQEKEKSGQSKAEKAGAEKVIVPFLGNRKCPMSGKEINAYRFFEHEGQRAYFCNRQCAKDGSKEPEKYLALAYPKTRKVGNKVCPLMGKKIDPNKAKTVTFQGHEVTLCCAKCEANFKKNPRIATLKALNPGLVDLKNKNCPVMTDEEVDGETMVIYKNKLVHLCCDTCVDEFVGAPDEFMKGLVKDK